MANLTTKELSALEDQIGYEQVLIKKYRAMACLCTDEKIRADFDSIASRHHNSLMTFLQ